MLLDSTPGHIISGSGASFLPPADDEDDNVQVDYVALEGEKERQPDLGMRVWTVAGCVGLCFWATSIAVSRILSETVGMFTSMAASFLFGGVVLNGILMAIGGFRKQLTCPMIYWALCGVPFTLYPFFFYLSLSQAEDDKEILLLTVINYLWPQILSTLGVVFLRQRWRLSLIPAIMGAIVCVAFMQFKPGMGIYDLVQSFVRVWPAAFSAFLGACCWASYSVAAKHFADQGFPSCVPLMTITGGVACLVGRCITGEVSPVPLLEAVQDPSFLARLLYMALVPACACRFAWDLACRRGHLPTLAAFAYLNPFLATVLNIILLGVPPTAQALMSALGLVACSVLASVSVSDPEEAKKQPSSGKVAPKEQP